MDLKNFELSYNLIAVKYNGKTLELYEYNYQCQIEESSELSKYIHRNKEFLSKGLPSEVIVHTGDELQFDFQLPRRPSKMVKSPLV